MFPPIRDAGKSCRITFAPALKSRSQAEGDFTISPSFGPCRATLRDQIFDRCFGPWFG
jgi:hypothetical protein